MSRLNVEDLNTQLTHCQNSIAEILVQQWLSPEACIEKPWYSSGSVPENALKILVQQ